MYRLKRFLNDVQKVPTKKKYVRPAPPPQPQNGQDRIIGAFQVKKIVFPIGGQVTVVRAIGRVMMGKLWFLGMNVAQGEPETKRISIIPSKKLVTRVSEQFYNTYRSSSPNNVMKKRNLDDSDDKYFGFDYEIQPCITNNLLRNHVTFNVLNSRSAKIKMLSRSKLKLLICFLHYIFCFILNICICVVSKVYKCKICCFSQPKKRKQN